MSKKSNPPAYCASPTSASSYPAERLPRVHGAILHNKAAQGTEPTPATALRLPQTRWPRPDDYLDEPDETHRWERIGEERREASPATPDHGDPHFELDALVKTHLAEAYVGSTDLKTRVSKKQEYASDTCVRRKGIDPATGSRYLEELVFEVVHKRSKKETRARAEGFAARGVRRQLGIFVREKEVREWQARAKKWGEALDLGQPLEDPCLAVPLPLQALFNPILAEAAMARALEAKDNPTIRQIKDLSEKRGRAKGKKEGRAEGKKEGRAEGKKEGRAEGLAWSILAAFQARDVDVSEEQRQRILAMTKLETLELWLRRAWSVSSPEDLT